MEVKSLYKFIDFAAHPKGNFCACIIMIVERCDTSFYDVFPFLLLLRTHTHTEK